MTIDVIIAEHSGFCFGVKRAVELAMTTPKTGAGNVYTWGKLIHNDHVVEDLRKKNIRPIDIKEIEVLGEEDTVIIRSHGIGPDTYDKIKKTGASLVDATCPFVTNVQKKAKKYYDLGYQIILVGDASHPEVNGVNAWCKNSAIITKDGSELTTLPAKVCVLSQTTQKLSNFEKTVKTASKLSPEVLSFNTICSATKERQKSAEELSKNVDAMIVIGGKQSSNSLKLYEICRGNCKNTVFVGDCTEIPETMFFDSKIKRIGITAGASTPDWIIADVMEQVKTKVQ